MKYYNLFIFISSFIRNIIDVYSIVFLFERGYSFREIIYIYIIVYFLGIFICEKSLLMGNSIKYKYVLMLSLLFNAIGIYLINNIHSVYLIGIILSLSIFSYHPIRHLYGIKYLDSKKSIGNTLIISYMGVFLSSFFIIKNINYNYLIMVSFFSIFFLFFIKDNFKEALIKDKISNRKICFFLLEQSRILFLLLEPLYLYMISNNISYVGIFNIILVISSVIYMYYISNKIDIIRIYSYINVLFVIVLLLKISVNNKSLLLLLAFFEELGIRTNEFVSNINLYSGNNNLYYIIVCEKIFCIGKVVILCIFYLLNISLNMMLYILIVGIFALSFIKKNDNDLS